MDGDGATFSEGKRYEGPHLTHLNRVWFSFRVVNKQVQNLRLESIESQDSRTSKIKVCSRHLC